MTASASTRWSSSCSGCGADRLEPLLAAGFGHRGGLAGAAPSASLAPPLDGLLLEGRYAVEGELARGGMGVVLRARDLEIDREVAVKVPDPSRLDAPGMVERFLREGRLCGRLQHPGIVPVYGMGTASRPYIAMRLVDGETLAQVLHRRRRPARKPSARQLLTWLRIFVQVCHTVGYAHAQGIVHRDLKPENVMIGGFGEVLVMDWGLAKQLSEPPRAAARAAAAPAPPEHPTLSGAGAVVGTPAYMAPEQARGEGKAVDQRADVFSLGAILCQILTGAPPYTGKTTGEVAARARCARLEDAILRLRRSGADPVLVRLAQRCLAPAPASRPPHGTAVAAVVATHLRAASAPGGAPAG